MSNVVAFRVENPCLLYKNDTVPVLLRWCCTDNAGVQSQGVEGVRQGAGGENVAGASKTTEAAKHAGMLETYHAYLPAWQPTVYLMTVAAHCVSLASLH